VVNGACQIKINSKSKAEHGGLVADLSGRSKSRAKAQQGQIRSRTAFLWELAYLHTDTSVHQAYPVDAIAAVRRSDKPAPPLTEYSLKSSTLSA
jgi:hypothetical protein